MTKLNFIFFTLNFLLVISQNINEKKQINNLINCINNTIIKGETIKQNYLNHMKKKTIHFFF